jgi:predicted NUDIX family NTP pyrophosphohydrolase
LDEVGAVHRAGHVSRQREHRRVIAGRLVGALQPLGEIRQRGGKHVIAFAAKGDFDPATLASKTFEIEWPPPSARLHAFPEVDRAEWFDLETAKLKMLSGQVQLLERLKSLA